MRELLNAIGVAAVFFLFFFGLTTTSLYWKQRIPERQELEQITQKLDKILQIMEQEK